MPASSQLTWAGWWWGRWLPRRCRERGQEVASCGSRQDCREAPLGPIWCGSFSRSWVHCTLRGGDYPVDCRAGGRFAGLCWDEEGLRPSLLARNNRRLTVGSSSLQRPCQDLDSGFGDLVWGRPWPLQRAARWCCRPKWAWAMGIERASELDEAAKTGRKAGKAAERPIERGQKKLKKM